MNVIKYLDCAFFNTSSICVSRCTFIKTIDAMRKMSNLQRGRTFDRFETKLSMWRTPHFI